MPERVNVDSDRGIAEILAFDEVTLEQMKVSQKQVAKAHRRYSLTGLLYDGRLIAQAPSEDELYSFAKGNTGKGKLEGMQFALLTSQESALPYMHLALPTAQCGHYVRVFADRQAALEWLGDGHNETGES